MKKLAILLTLGFLVLITGTVSGQDTTKSKAIQLTGIVVNSDSSISLPGIHVYVPKAGRGTITNQYGYFSMPVLPGDSVAFSSVAHKDQYYIVPENRTKSKTMLIELESDTTYLQNVDILPYPTAESFKQAVLALRLPQNDKYATMRQQLNNKLLNQMARDISMGPSGNYQMFLQQQQRQMYDEAGPRTNPLLNPFRWAEFIQKLRDGDVFDED